MSERERVFTIAERRMFAKTIIDSDAFLDMPHTAQNLYFHLCMRADDEGFINKPKMIQRMIGCNDDDMKVLLSKKFIIIFESGVIVVKHWMIHNYIRKDRLVETMYKEEKELLTIDENGAYTFNKFNEINLIEEPNLTAKEKRKIAYEESSLPYSFDYKIKHAFWHKPCPVCGNLMELGEFGHRGNIPTVQHNIPLSKGGRHELDNISVICLACNTSIQDEICAPYNTEEVIEEWDKICMSDKQLTSDNQMTTKSQHRLGKDSIGKDSIVEEKNISSDKPKKHTYGEYKHVKLTDEEMNKLINEYGQAMYSKCITFLDEYIEMKGYKAKSHYLAIRKWVVDAVNEREHKRGVNINEQARRTTQEHTKPQWTDEELLEIFGDRKM